MSTEDNRPVVLAVDDTPENLDVVRGILVPDYRVKAVTSGAAALKVAAAQPPDIILLDIMMPDMNGYEVCEQLKADPVTAAIPVIFLTAMEQTADETEGFALGAADYIRKPVNPPILRARVRTHVELKRSADTLRQLNEELAVAKARMEQELNVGRDIQRSMLPLALPPRAQFSLSASMDAAREVGGDFYDFYYLDQDQGRLCFCVADVSGKGVGAALFMAMAKLLLKSRAGDGGTAAEIVTRVNHDLAGDNPECMFVTLFLGVLDLSSGELTYTNAGHNPPLLRRADGQWAELEGRHGPLLGIEEDRVYVQNAVQLAAGDLLMVFTDGVTEAMDPSDSLYGDDRLMATVAAEANPTADGLLDAVRASVNAFADGAAQADDITLLALQYHGADA